MDGRVKIKRDDKESKVRTIKDWKLWRTMIAYFLEEHKE